MRLRALIRSSFLARCQSACSSCRSRAARQTAAIEAVEAMCQDRRCHCINAPHSAVGAAVDGALPAKHAELYDRSDTGFQFRCNTECDIGHLPCQMNGR
jgi:hypothetical protein